MSCIYGHSIRAIIVDDAYLRGLPEVRVHGRMMIMMGRVSVREWPVDEEYRSIMHESSFGGSCPGSPTINIILNELWLTVQYMVQLPCQLWTMLPGLSSVPNGKVKIVWMGEKVCSSAFTMYKI